MKGWKYDSHRHMLAAKGFKSLKSNKFYVKKELSTEQLEQIKNEELKQKSLEPYWVDSVQKGDLGKAELAMHDIEESKKNVRVIRYSAQKDEVSIPKHVMEKAWWKTDKNETAKEYMDRNLKGHEKDGEHRFRAGVRKMAEHPVNDLDDEWKEYTKVANGRSERLSDDRFERTTQRGAALVGRVVTQSNVEPLTDKDQNRSFRDLALDFEFGRRT